MSATTDWTEWHRPYDDPASSLSRRLVVVQSAIESFLERTGGRPRVLSVCAGQSRDILGVLERRPQTRLERLTLIESSPDLCASARTTASRLGVEVDIRSLDAGQTDSYVGAVPADLVLLCGVFGNISDADVARTVRSAAEFCAPGATLIWTRHTKDPDLTPQIRAWFADAGFEDVDFVAPTGDVFGVGVQRLVGDPCPLRLGRRLFTFWR